MPRTVAPATAPVIVDGLRFDAPKSWQKSSGKGGVRHAAMDAHVADTVAPLLGLIVTPTMIQTVCCGSMVMRPGHAPATVDAPGYPAPVVVGVVQFDRALAPGQPYAPGLIVPVCPGHNGTGYRATAMGRIRAAAVRVAEAIGQPAP